MTGASANMGAVQEHIYTSDGSYPNGVNLTGVPPAGGWMFYWGSCCRNPCTNIINSNSMSWRLRAMMYPYNNQNVNNCFDNSPKFAEIPRTVICTGYPFTYNHNATDAELDSLKYEWGIPLLSTGNPIVAYAAGYAYNNPLPGPTQNPNNVAAAINQFTGEISFTSYTNGAFVTSTKVTAYKCGTKVAEIWRDMQIVLLQCGTNSPPNVTPPFQNATGQYTLFTDTVYAGEQVCFNISGTDFQFLPNGSPQTMELQATGAQFGNVIPGAGSNPATMSTTAGCLNPPCASLTPAPNPPNQPLQAQFGLQTQFCWQTTCDHLATNIGCGSTSNVYNFVFKVFDDYCPAPAINIATITIVVLTKPTLPPPPIRCVSVDETTGDVTLTWVPLIDTMGTFDSYHIFTSTNKNGPYTILDSIFNINTGTYTHVGANGQNNQLFYYMRTRAGCDSNQYSAPGDTTATIFMDVTNPGPALGISLQDWNHIYDTLYPSSSGVYRIYWQVVKNGTTIVPWTQIGTTTDTAYVDTITLCDAELYYKVEIDDTLGFDSTGNPIICTSKSSWDYDVFQDLTPPLTPTIDSVTVDRGNSKSFISWNKNSSPDTDGYVIYHFTGGAWTPIDTVWGIDSTSYFDMLNDPCTNFQSYRVAAFDSCMNVSPMSIKHNTIKVIAVPDICDDKMNISWNPYVNMSPALGGYELYYTENGGPLTFLATVTAADTTYEHVGLTNNSIYCYYVVAYSGSGNVTSTSCLECRIANKPRQPQFIYIRTATVLDNNIQVGLKIHCDTSGFVSENRVYRAEDPAGPYSLITSLPQPTASPLLEYVDGTAGVREKSYYYKVTVIDSCGNEVLESNVARTIFLEVQANDDLTNEIFWNDYEGWDPPVSGIPVNYIVYRKVDGVFNPVFPITMLGSGSGSYLDDVDKFGTSGGRFEYVVQALEGPGNQYGFSDTAQSNQVLAMQKPKLYVPNAFYPNSDFPENAMFMPVGVYINSDGYLFQVFNRWGEKIFETTEVNDGWNGTYKEVEAPTGTYIYYVKFNNSRGELFEKRGTVTLLR
jgi:gliding motility-associated-like protein